MCGIAGYLGPRVPGRLADMVDRMVHRGPDGRGLLEDDELGAFLGMRRLSIVDLEGGDQPKSSDDGQVSVLFNGEIYNHVELRDELAARGVVFASTSDTEVILHGYLREGLAYLARMVGMFAISILDRRSGELLLVRDRLGKKPIYYVDEPEVFAYASEYPVVASLLERPLVLDREALTWYFSQKTTPGTRSIDARIHKVPAGHLLRVRLGTERRVALERWWTIDAGRVPGAARASEVEAALAIEELLTSAVKLRMRADVEVGAFLSGGIDSSLVVALASREATLPLKTYCLVYEQEINHKSADRRWARAIAERYGTHHHEVLLTPQKLADALPVIVRHYGQPNAAVLSNWFISEVMGKELKVALSGDGADELFGSYYLHRAAASIAALAERGEAAIANVPSGEAAFARAHAGGPHAILADAFAVFPEEELRRLAPGLGVSPRAMLESRERELTTRHPVDRALELDCRNLLVDQILNYADVLSMAHSLEVRTPFLDHRLVDYVFSVDPSTKMLPGETKRLLKMVARKHLPEELVARPKEGFVEPAVYWIADELSDLVRHYLLSGSFNALGLVDASYVRELTTRFLDEKDFTTGKKVWNLLVYAVWEAHVGTR